MYTKDYYIYIEKHSSQLGRGTFITVHYWVHNIGEAFSHDYNGHGQKT